LAAIAAFLKYLAGMKYLAGKNIAYLSLYHEIMVIPRQKVIRKKVTGMSKEAMKILMSIPNVSTKTGQRDLVLLIVLYSTAARIDGVLSMKINQLHLDANKSYITVIGKGRKSKNFVSSSKSCGAFEKVLERLSLGKTKSQYLCVLFKKQGYNGKNDSRKRKSTVEKICCHCTSYWQ
jgi:site-specific recombinase XerD